VAAEQVRTFNEELRRKKDMSAEEKAQLEARIKVKENEISFLNQLLFNSRTTGLWTTFSAEPTEYSEVKLEGISVANCSVCGESYYKSSKDPDPYGRCPRCMTEGRMPAAN
jgi:hypothetical protein